MDQPGFPDSTVVNNPPPSAGDTSSNPGLGRSHMPVCHSLSPFATVDEPVLWSPDVTTAEPTCSNF